jgi:hypothetical protein
MPHLRHATRPWPRTRLHVVLCHDMRPVSNVMRPCSPAIHPFQPAGLMRRALARCLRDSYQDVYGGVQAPVTCRVVDFSEDRVQCSEPLDNSGIGPFLDGRRPPWSKAGDGTAHACLRVTGRRLHACGLRDGACTPAPRCLPPPRLIWSEMRDGTARMPCVCMPAPHLARAMPKWAAPLPAILRALAASAACPGQPWSTPLPRLPACRCGGSTSKA